MRSLNKKILRITTIIISLIILTEIISNIRPYEVPDIFQNKNLNQKIKSFHNFNRSSNFTSRELSFIRTPSNDTIYLIDVRNLSKDELLTAVSLQGIVNRDLAVIYLIYSYKELQWLEYLQSVSIHTFKRCTLQEAIKMFSNKISGAVIFDNSDISINLATTYSGLNDAIMIRTGKDTYNQKIIKDATEYDGNTYIDIYEDYFRFCNREVIANFAPYDIKSRDYIIQNRMLCLFLQPGPFSWPGENYQLINIIKDFSAGSNGSNRWLFGWFQTPTITEEDYTIQLLSHYGVILIPCTNVPNLSILQSINATYNPVKKITNEKKSEKKVYITFGLADGDSLDVMYKHMNSYWYNQYRGQIPISWSINPAVISIAPIMMQYYYNTSESNDSFIAAGSGMGIIFSDFFEPKLLLNYVKVSSSYGLDNVWLLNSYTPYETRYSDNVLEIYAEYYDGIVLDYGSLPIKSPFWKQHNTPIARSLHYMGNMDDFKAKLDTITTFSENPLFLFITLYPWIDLDIAGVLDAIDIVCEDYEFITIDQFFYLINRTAINPNHIDDTRRSLASIQQYDSEIQRIMVNEGWIILISILTLGVWIIIFEFKKPINNHKTIEDKTKRIYLLYFGTANSLFLSIIIWVIYQNYWQWLSLAIIPIIAIIYPIVRKKSNNNISNKPIIAAFLLAISAIFSVIFPIALLLGAYAYFKIAKSNPELIVKTYSVSVAIGFILSFMIWTTWAVLPLILILCLSGSKLNELNKNNIINFDFNTSSNPNTKNNSIKKLKAKFRNKIKISFLDFFSTFLPAIFISLAILPAFYLDMFFINLKLDYNGYLILTLSFIIPIISYPIGLWLIKFYRFIKLTFSFSWLLILISPLPLITVFILIIIQAQIYAIGIYLFRNHVKNPNLPHRHIDFAKNLSTFPILIGLVIVFPPMIFSVYIMKLPLLIINLLYFTPLLYCFISVLLTIGIIYLDQNSKKEK